MIVVLSAAIICIAFLTESVFGFGAGLIAIPLISLFLGVQNAVTTVLIFQLGMGILLVKSYKNVDWRHAFPLVAGLLLGTCLGMYGLATIDGPILTKILAIAIFAFLLFSIFGKSFSLPKSNIMGVLCGVAGGWLQGLIGTGGPVFTMYLSGITKDRYIFRATLIFALFVTSLIRTGASFSLGLFNQQVLTIALWSAIPYVGAIFMGNKLHVKVDQKHFRIGVNILLFFVAISLLLK